MYILVPKVYILVPFERAPSQWQLLFNFFSESVVNITHAITNLAFFILWNTVRF